MVDIYYVYNYIFLDLIKLIKVLVIVFYFSVR